MKWHELDPELKPSLFSTSAESPGAWLFAALALKDSANRIDWVRYPIREEEDSLSLALVYRFLLALSIENLLKGILVVQGEPVLKDESLSEEYRTHSLRKLAGAIAPTRLAFSNADLELLGALEPYSVWAGRYPIPKRMKDLIMRGHSSMEYESELALWERLCDYLVSTGWVTKAGGRRLYFRRPTAVDKSPPDDA